MFGAWDEKDPKSAEGFTVIFQKVKEEKHIAATNFPPIPQQPTYNHNASNKNAKRSKVCIPFHFYFRPTRFLENRLIRVVFYRSSVKMVKHKNIT